MLEALIEAAVTELAVWIVRVPILVPEPISPLNVTDPVPAKIFKSLPPSIVVVAVLKITFPPPGPLLRVVDPASVTAPEPLKEIAALFDVMEP